jgi:hypothetical protein
MSVEEKRHDVMTIQGAMRSGIASLDLSESFRKTIMPDYNHGVSPFDRMRGLCTSALMVMEGCETMTEEQLDTALDVVDRHLRAMAEATENAQA